MKDTLKQLQEERAKLLEWSEKVGQALKNVPQGSLAIRIKKDKPEYYWRINRKKEVYLKKDQMSLVKVLAQKSYLLEVESYIKNQIDTIQTFLENYSTTSVSDYYHHLSNSRKELVTPICIPDEIYTRLWQEEAYSGKGFAVNESEILTEKGERVRSKSEKIIADKLLSLGIPYKYEHPLQLARGGVIYPDFTLLDVEKRKEVYYEHFGMMDNPEYAEKAVRKIENYIRNGYIPGNNLIFTFETSRHPLDMRCLETELRAIWAEES